MHKLRVINYGKPKIMINSAQVELKNINIFNKKNHLGSFCKNGKEFI
jgi:hypothetical protein